jgi:hypothetical protein
MTRDTTFAFGAIGADGPLRPVSRAAVRGSRSVLGHLLVRAASQHDLDDLSRLAYVSHLEIRASGRVRALSLPALSAASSIVVVAPGLQRLALPALSRVTGLFGLLAEKLEVLAVPRLAGVDELCIDGSQLEELRLTALVRARRITVARAPRLRMVHAPELVGVDQAVFTDCEALEQVHAPKLPSTSDVLALRREGASDPR